VSLPPVPLRVPVLAENGLISRDWVRYFTALSDGISGAISGESLTVTGAITGASLLVTGDVTAADVHATRFFRTDYAAAQGEWTAFTPSWTNLTVGNGSVTGKYTRLGKTAVVEGLVVFGNTTTVGGAISIGSLPVSNTASAAVLQLGDVAAYDASAAQTYSGYAFTTGATTAALYASGSPLAPMTAAVPFVWTTSDQLFLRLCYQEP
jgi:hypothetical protein